jgi:hypothetical protein
MIDSMLAPHRGPFGLIVAVLVLGLGCEDGGEPEPEPGRITVLVEHFPVVSGRLYYELRARDAATEVSLGQFRVTADGELRDLLDEGSPVFAPAIPFDLSGALAVTIAVEQIAAEERGPVLVAGDVVSDAGGGRAACAPGHPLALGVDLGAAAGSFILASPTDLRDDNETHGVWFTDPAGEPALALPAISGGWLYGGWIFAEGHSITLGHFARPDSADLDGPGPEAWPGGQGYGAPGSDFVVFGMDLAAGGVGVFITLEPAFLAGGHRSQLPEQAAHDSSFPLRLLATEIPAGAAPHASIALEQPAPLPAATVVLAR